MSFWNCVFVGIGGFAGAVLRYFMSFLPLPGSSSIPVTTMAVNVLGAFAIGVISAAAFRYAGMDERALLFLKIGVCGGFTTFSTFSLESADLFSAGKAMIAILYIFLSVALCLAAVAAGRWLVMAAAG